MAAKDFENPFKINFIFNEISAYRKALVTPSPAYDYNDNKQLKSGHFCAHVSSNPSPNPSEVTCSFGTLR